MTIWEIKDEQKRKYHATRTTRFSRWIADQIGVTVFYCEPEGLLSPDQRQWPRVEAWMRERGIAFETFLDLDCPVVSIPDPNDALMFYVNFKDEPGCR